MNKIISLKFLLKEEIGDENEPRIISDFQLKQDNFFIRFGKFGKNASKPRFDSEFTNDVLGGKQNEAGLSVYFVEKKEDKWNIVPPISKEASYHLGQSYFSDMLFDIFSRSIANDEVYIIKGDLIEISYKDYDYGRDEYVFYTSYRKGSDGEPVIDPNSIEIIESLSTEEVLNNIVYNKGKLIGDFTQFNTKLRDSISDYYDEE